MDDEQKNRFNIEEDKKINKILESNEKISKEIIVNLDEDKAERIRELKDEIDKKKDEIEKIENNDDEYTSQYDDMLDDCNPIIKIGTLEYYPSNVLKNCDEIAYNCGYSEYTDSIITDLKDEIAELEDEIKDIYDEDSEGEDE